MTQLVELIEAVVASCEYWRPTIALLTTLQAGLIAVMVLSLRRLALQEERWARHFGLGFLAFAILYAANTVDAYAVKQLGRHLIPTGTTAFYWVTVIRAFLSAVTSVLFVAAARVLLSGRLPWTGFIDVRLFKFSVIMIAGFAAVVMVFGEVREWQWYGVFDGAVSAYCVLALSHGIWMCLRPTRFYRSLGGVVIITGSCYALLLVALSFVPLTPAEWWSSLAEAVRERLGRAEVNAHVRALEATGMALAFLLKLGLFLGAFALMTTAIAVPWHAAEGLKNLAQQRHDFPSAAFLRALLETVRADAIELCLLRSRVRGTGVSYWRLARFDTTRDVTAMWIPTPPRVDCVAWRVLEKNRDRPFQKSVDRTAFDGSPVFAAERFPSLSIMGVPIQHSGAPIGSLVFWWTKPYSISATVIRRAWSLARWFASGFQLHRQLTALHDSSMNLSAYHGRRGRASVASVTRELVEVIRRVLRPIALGVSFDFGFSGFRFSCNDTKSLPCEEQAGFKERLHDEVSGLAELETRDALEFATAPLEIAFAREPDTDATVTAADSATTPPCKLGELELAIRRGADASDRPTLVGNEQLREAAGAEIAGAFLEYFRRRFDALLAWCHSRLLMAQQVGSIESWFHAVSDCAKEAGAIWAVVTIEGSVEFWGPPEAVEIVRSIQGPPARERGVRKEIRHHPLLGAGGQARHAIEIVLPRSHHLWLGIPRRDFGPELDHQTPWGVFIERLAEAADATLESIYARSELRQLEIKAARDQAIVTVGAIQASMTHRLGNLSRDVASGCRTLLTAHAAGKLREVGHATKEKPYRDLIRSMMDSADELVTLTKRVFNVITFAERRQCRLLKAIEQVGELHRASLQGRYVSFEYSVGADLQVDLPSDVVLLTLSTLIENAIEAKPEHARIVITSRDLGDHAECRVYNNGPAIPENIRDEIFKAGFTTKKDSRGFGLYFIRRALRENGGDIMVETSDHQGTTFLLRFPKPQNPGG